jgi:hypothetical protein
VERGSLGAYRLTIYATGVREKANPFLFSSLPFYIPIRVVDGQVHMYIYPSLILGQASYTTCTTRSGLIYAVIFTLVVPHC